MKVSSYPQLEAMKTTIIAITIGLTFRAIVCEDIKPTSYTADNQVTKITTGDSLAACSNKLLPKE